MTCESRFANGGVTSEKRARSICPCSLGSCSALRCVRWSGSGLDERVGEVKRCRAAALQCTVTGSDILPYFVHAHAHFAMPMAMSMSMKCAYKF